jgi:hypothetical protein
MRLRAGLEVTKKRKSLNPLEIEPDPSVVQNVV